MGGSWWACSTEPDEFRADVLLDRLPSVSWIIPPLLNCEHPALPPSFGAVTLIEILDILTANPKVWEKTALIISYDENGGFYDHVAPPTPPPGTPGEYLTVNPMPSTADGISGPIGLGFRVPGLVISPFSRGGLVASEVFDHTSQLKLIAKRFGVEVPNLSAWRDKTVGDMTSAFDFATTADPSTPKLAARKELDTASTLAQCKVGVDGIQGTFFGNQSRDTYPAPSNNAAPTQAGTPHRRAPSGPVRACAPVKSTKSATAPAADPAPGVTKIPVARAKSTTPSRIAAAAESLQSTRLADTGPDTTRTALAGAALLAAGVVTVAAAPQVAATMAKTARQAPDGDDAHRS